MITTEKAFGKTVRGIYFLANPVKKIFIKTTCIVHKHINSVAVEILKKNCFQEEYKFFSKNLCVINEGTVWADQDFRSSNHFFHYEKNKGLFGFSNALEECKKYYSMSIKFLRCGDKNKSLFYFGVACHVLQDSTVPQHVHNRLLDKHRKFELWIIGKLLSGYKFEKASEVIEESSIEKYVKNNAKFSSRVYNKYNAVLNREMKYTGIANSIIPRAEMTTAGLMLNYYKKFLEITEFKEN
ncbi:zinc dependent phospholipase C family protein [Clostridium guangxiense]|uniref:zinc dependent phospholipase C family protein n=1 Tax=Clostridium guangxiense TaxID=1662055 RepID=UPI001E33C93E|nr:zinc dependent phospholipase C family protein [Clostridium guangxiense]MCD2346512.1 zinc dependent phospholipase C family protein [Clostridium guangxiense]